MIKFFWHDLSRNFNYHEILTTLIATTPGGGSPEF